MLVYAAKKDFAGGEVLKFHKKSNLYTIDNRCKKNREKNA